MKVTAEIPVRMPVRNMGRQVFAGRCGEVVHLLMRHVRSDGIRLRKRRAVLSGGD
jgi:hypothetical protein